MKEFTFSGEHQTPVFDLLLVEEADILDMSEGQLMECLPYMLTKISDRQYR